jgi:hypothetical protein
MAWYLVNPITGGGVSLPINISDVTNLQDSLDGKQPKSDAAYQMGNASGGWTAMTVAQQNALNSGLAAADKTKLDGISAGATANAKTALTPLMNGTAAIGNDTGYAAGNHVHPSDTSREPSITAGTASQYWRGDKAWAAFPSIPAAQVNSDWNATSGVAQILNKPTIPSAVTGVNQQANLGSGAAANSITAPTIGVTGTLPVANGGTGIAASTTPNQVFATAASGTTATAPSFRALVNADLPVMGGATASAAGVKGAVPAPSANYHQRFLRGDGTWAVPESSSGNYLPLTGGELVGSTGDMGRLTITADDITNAQYVTSQWAWKAQSTAKSKAIGLRWQGCGGVFEVQNSASPSILTLRAGGATVDVGINGINLAGTNTNIGGSAYITESMRVGNASGRHLMATSDEFSMRGQASDNASIQMTRDGVYFSRRSDSAWPNHGQGAWRIIMSGSGSSSQLILQVNQTTSTTSPNWVTRATFNYAGANNV